MAAEEKDIADFGKDLLKSAYTGGQQLVHGAERYNEEHHVVDNIKAGTRQAVAGIQTGIQEAQRYNEEHHVTDQVISGTHSGLSIMSGLMTHLPDDECFLLRLDGTDLYLDIQGGQVWRGAKLGLWTLTGGTIQ